MFAIQTGPRQEHMCAYHTAVAADRGIERDGENSRGTHGMSPATPYRARVTLGTRKHGRCPRLPALDFGFASPQCSSISMLNRKSVPINSSNPDQRFYWDSDRRHIFLDPIFGTSKKSISCQKLKRNFPSFGFPSVLQVIFFAVTNRSPPTTSTKF